MESGNPKLQQGLNGSSSKHGSNSLAQHRADSAQSFTGHTGRITCPSQQTSGYDVSPGASWKYPYGLHDFQFESGP
jgi:hypothetical protein